MTIEKLSATKLRIYITEEDMKEWDLRPDMLTYNSPEAQMLFNDVLVQARNECGFICDGSNVVIEAVPDNEVGLKVMLTVVDEKGNTIEDESEAEAPPALKTQKIVLKLTNIEDVTAACQRLLSVYNGQSHFFKYQNCYFIVLQTSGVTYSSIYDLGEIIDDPDMFYGFLVEYGDAIVRNDFLVKGGAAKTNTRAVGRSATKITTGSASNNGEIKGGGSSPIITTKTPRVRAKSA